jgi:hypothetical protein
MSTPSWSDAVNDANQRERDAHIQDVMDAWEASRSGGKHAIEPGEREALQEYLADEKERQASLQRGKEDIANRKATQDLGLTEIDGSLYDRWGRECRPDGTRY